MNAAAKRHMDRVRRLPCVPCLLIFGKTHPCEEVHHVESVRDELSDLLIIPTCRAMHQGPIGIHGLHRRQFERRYKIDELAMLGKVNELLA